MVDGEIQPTFGKGLAWGRTTEGGQKNDRIEETTEVQCPVEKDQGHNIQEAGTNSFYRKTIREQEYRYRES